MELIITNKVSDCITISTELPASKFNNELLTKLFQIVFNSKGIVRATSNYKNIHEACKFIDNVFQLSTILQL